MAEQDGQEKTEQPTGKKLEDSRQDGKVAKSTEISSFAVFGSGLLILFIAQGFIGKQLSSLSIEIFKSLDTLEIQINMVQLYVFKAIAFFFITISPFLIGIVVFALAANISQVGFRITPKALAPKFDKLNPAKGIKNVFFSTKSVIEVLKSLAKLFIIGLFTYYALDDFIMNSSNLLDQSVAEIAEYMSVAAVSFLWKIILVYAVIAITDFIFQKYKFKKDMMMTKQEVKEENKQTNGDPFIKGKIKNKQFEMASKRMMQAVPEADVVVTNPTHFAVAIKYDAAKNSAPIVLAKGMDDVAMKIKELARKNNVPIFEDKPLARALYKYCQIGEEIPEKLFQAVAKVLAFVYKAKNSKKKSIV